MTEAPRRPAFTVVVATFNCAGTLERCLGSVETQTLADWELVVIDGGSTDGTVEILLRHETQLTSWLSEPDRGVADAWNKGVERSRGEWLLFLGGDDYLWSPTVLAEGHRQLSSAPPTVRVAYGRVELVSPQGEALARVGRPWSEVATEFGRTMAIPHQGVFHRRSLFAERGLFDPTFVIAGDYEFLLRELKDAAPLFLPEPLVAAMQTGGLSSDPENVYAMSCEFARARHKQGLIGTAEYRRQLLRARVRRTVQGLLGPRAAHRVTALLRRLQGRPELPRFGP